MISTDSGFRVDTPSDRLVASIVANDPKLRTMLAILRALSPGEADACIEGWPEDGAGSSTLAGTDIATRRRMRV